jgi:hypothetical protein
MAISSKQQKIRLLSRLNRQKAGAPQFLMALSEALNEPIAPTCLLAPSEADSALELFQAGYKIAVDSDATSYRKFFRMDEQRAVLRFAKCLSQRIDGERGLFLTKINGGTVVIALNIAALLKNAALIIALDGDSISALSKDCKEGILIDHNEGETDEAFEVAVWGLRWPLLALACDRA